MEVTLEQIAERIDNIDKKMDLMLSPVKEDVTELKNTVHEHTGRINTLELFKEGHQASHEKENERRREITEKHRFNWEIIASSGIVSAILGGIIIWVSDHIGGG